MEADCLKCHNNPATGSPKTDWQLDDVRGAVEIIRPLDNAVALNYSRLQWTILGTVAVYGLGPIGQPIHCSFHHSLSTRLSWHPLLVTTTL